MDGSKGSKASKSKAVSYKRLLALEGQFRAEVEQLSSWPSRPTARLCPPA